MLRNSKNIIVHTGKIFPAECCEAFLDNTKEAINITDDKIFLKYKSVNLKKYNWENLPLEALDPIVAFW